MSETDDPQPTFSRRALVGGVAFGALTASINTATAQQPNFEQHSMAELLEIVRTNPDRAFAVQALTDVFARCGIAVFDETITRPLFSLRNQPSPLAFVESQIGTMVDELRQPSYRAAGGYDTFGPEVSKAGDPVPSFSDMYVRYGQNGTTPGSDFVRAVLMTTPDGNGEMPANLVPAPSAAVSVLTGEILGELQTSLNRDILSQIPTVPSLPQLPDIENPFELPPLPELDNQVCANVQMFVTSVIQRVLSVLEQTRDVVTIPIIDQIFGAIVGVVKFGLRVIIKAIDVVIAPVMGVLKSIAAAVAIASNILGTVSMWTVKVEVTPDKTRLGQGPIETITGEIHVNAGGADDIPWPAIVTNCASTLGLAVPTRASAGSPVALTITNPSDKELVYLGLEERILDSTGKMTVTYATRNESQTEIDKGQEEIGVVYIEAEVEREDLRVFSEHLVDLLLAELPTIIADVLRDLTQATVLDLRNNLLKMLHSSATTRMYVTYHRMHCLIGHFYVANTHSIQMVSVWDGVPAENGTGTFHWWFNAEGTCTFSWDGTVIYWANSTTSYYSGVAEGTFVVTDGIVRITFTHTNGTMVATSPFVASDQTYTFTPAQLEVEYGQFSLACGDTIYMRNMTWGDIWWLAPVVA